MLEVDTTQLEKVLRTEEGMKAFAIIGSSKAGAMAIAVGRNWRYAETGTKKGEVILYDTNTWRTKYVRLRRLKGAVWGAAISNDGIFLGH